MYNNLIQLIQQNFNIEIINIEIITDHSSNNDSKVYLVESATEKYALKEMAPEDKLEDEGNLMSHLIDQGIKVPKIYHTIDGNHLFVDNGLQYILYEFIEGTIFDLNTAPDWFLIKSAQTLGQIHSALNDYKHLPIEIGPEIFLEEELASEEQFIKDRLEQAAENNDVSLVAALNERLRHMKRISQFKFDCDKFTYVNTHGDFYINQVIVKDKEFVVIDWTQFGRNPACFEVIISYAYAAPECKNGAIDIAKFKPYLDGYLKYAPYKLTHYDLKMMPYLLYHHCAFWSFAPPYDDLPEEYKKIASLTDNLANWLYDNVDNLSRDLCAV
jgi:Ser/Thr protein kinase RdoA (MazF antagonist)